MISCFMTGMNTDGIDSVTISVAGAPMTGAAVDGGGLPVNAFAGTTAISKSVAGSGISNTGQFH